LSTSIIDNIDRNRDMYNINSIMFGDKLTNGDKEVKDPFMEIQSKKSEWNEGGMKSFVKDLVYHTDFDHPMSFH
jgi:hypothetical protein